MITKSGAELLEKANFPALKFRDMEKTAVTRWKGLLSGLSSAARGKLAPIAKPLEVELAGINRGSFNIAKRYGYEVVPVNTGDFSTSSTKKLIRYTPYEYAMRDRNIMNYRDIPDEELPIFEAVALRHEALEALHGSKLKNKTGKYHKYEIVTYPERTIHWDTQYVPNESDLSIRDRIRRDPEVDTFIRSIGLDPDRFIFVGRHNSPKVLADETKLINQSYHTGFGTNDLKNSRRDYGEARLLLNNAGLSTSTGDLYSRVLTKRDYKNMSKHRRTLAAMGTKNPETGDKLITRVDFA